jgi:signal transduction histidine kinase
MCLSEGNKILEKTRFFATRITLIYIVLGITWILFSDKLMFVVFDDTHTLNLVSTYKGWFYVLLTGWLLYMLITRELKKRNAIEEMLKKARDKAEESEKLKSAFLNNISHEIRTPLNAILGFSELIVNRDLTEDQKTAFSGYIKRGTTDLVDTIEDILIVSKIQVGQVSLEETREDVIKLLEDLIEYYKAQLTTQQSRENLVIGLNHSLNPDERLIKVDFRHLKQILSKLLGNAIKFTDHGSVIINVQKQSANELLFTVKDTGIGIPTAKQAVVFDPFRQADETLLHKKTGGNGLGLSIAKGLVQLMKGKIWFDSTEGEGSTFYFTIPTLK